MILWLLGCASLMGPNLHTVHFAKKNKNHEKLMNLLLSAEYSYLRERSAKALRESYKRSPDMRTTQSLRQCLRKKKEQSFVRGQCALTLGAWKVDAAAKDIYLAFKQVDPEAQYMMAVALKSLSSNEARQYFQRLGESQDLYISALVSEAR